MANSNSKLTVFFEEPFWAAVAEHEFCGKYEVSKIIFGAEPKDCEIYAFILKNYDRLQFSPPVKAKLCTLKPINPKRLQRTIKKQLNAAGVGTKAQQALKLSQEQNKLERKVHSRKQKEAAKERLYALRQEKHKKKHKGH